MPAPSLQRLVLGLLVVAWGLGSGRAQEQAPPRPRVSAELQAGINAAIDAGAERLLGQQELDGSWAHDIFGYGCGATALAVYTLHHCGLGPAHPSMRRALQYIERHPPTKVYSLACTLMALAGLDDKAHDDALERHTKVLLSSLTSAGWGYPDGEPDLSNTQFGALGLAAAARRGVKVPASAWKDLAQAALRHAAGEPGSPSSEAIPVGFRYKVGEVAHEHPTGSMTSAGIGVLTICLDHLRGRVQPLVRARESGLVWLARNFTIEHNPAPGAEHGEAGHYYYYLYGLERVGSLLEVERIGEHEWYRLGAERLVQKQNADGGWGSMAETCFSLLFLTRATERSGAISGVANVAGKATWGGDSALEDVSIRGYGRGELRIWISSVGDAALAAHGVEVGERFALPIERVEYCVLVEGEPRVVATLDADPTKPAVGARFSAILALDDGTHDVIARVSLLHGDVRTALVSKPMTVTLRTTDSPELLDYEDDPEQNLLSDVSVSIVASSVRPEEAAFAPANVLDGSVAIGWKPSLTDREPWLRLECKRPVRGNTLLLSHLPTTGRRFERFELIVNGRDKDPISGVLDTNPKRKTVVDLGAPVRIRSLELRFPGHEPEEPCGLGELELQLRR